MFHHKSKGWSISALPVQKKELVQFNAWITSAYSLAASKTKGVFALQPPSWGMEWPRKTEKVKGKKKTISGDEIRLSKGSVIVWRIIIIRIYERVHKSISAHATATTFNHGHEDNNYVSFYIYCSLACGG